MRNAAEVLDYLYLQHSVQHLNLNPRNLILDNGWLQLAEMLLQVLNRMVEVGFHRADRAAEAVGYLAVLEALLDAHLQRQNSRVVDERRDGSELAVDGCAGRRAAVQPAAQDLVLPADGLRGLPGLVRPRRGEAARRGVAG